MGRTVQLGRSRATLATLSLAALTLAACTGSNSGTPQGSSTGKTFTWDTYTNIISDWDPAIAYSAEPEAFMNIYQTLTLYNPQTHKVEPVLATSWKSSKDKLTWTFTLRKGVTFHNGDPLTAQAVKDSILRTKRIGQGASYIFDPISSIDTPNPSTVIFHLSSPEDMPLAASSDYGAFIYDTKASGTQNLHKWFEEGNEAGTGPYELKTWNNGATFPLILVAYPHYWGGWSGSHFTRIDYEITRDMSTAAQLMNAGQIDFRDQLTPQLWQAAKSQDTAFRMISNPTYRTMIIFFNTQTGPLSHLSVRRAVEYGIDYNGIMTALKGAGVRQTGIVPAGLFGHFSDLPTYTYDPARAKQLLAEAGYGPGHQSMTLTFTLTQGDTNEATVAAIMKSDLAKLNINLNVEPVDTTTKYAIAQNKDPNKRQDITVAYEWPDYASPIAWFASMLHTNGSFNYSYYSNKAADKTIDKLVPTEATNPEKAAQMYKQLQLLVFHQAPLFSMYTAKSLAAIKASIGNYVENPAYPYVVFVYNLTP